MDDRARVAAQRSPRAGPRAVRVDPAARPRHGDDAAARRRTRARDRARRRWPSPAAARRPRASPPSCEAHGGLRAIPATEDVVTGRPRAVDLDVDPERLPRAARPLSTRRWPTRCSASASARCARRRARSWPPSVAPGAGRAGPDHTLRPRELPGTGPGRPGRAARSREHLGGTGDTTVAYAAAMEEITAACPATSLVYMTQMHAAYPILIAGDAELAARVHPRPARRLALRLARASPSPMPGSDVVEPATTATPRRRRLRALIGLEDVHHHRRPGRRDHLLRHGRPRARP